MPSVIDAIGEADRRMDGVVLLGAEINFATKSPEIVKASIDWEAAKRQSKHCSIAVRVAPFAGPFRQHDAAARAIVALSREMIEEARVHELSIEEFQFDFDCAQKNLDGYRTWVQALKPIVHPNRFVITALPSWLDDSQFRRLVQETDGFVLQVHSVPLSSTVTRSLCDTKLAVEWINKAAKLGMPFSVALPTYRCSAGYGGDGKLLSVAMDSVQPSWPPGTRVLEFNSNAKEIAQLIAELEMSRPSNLREVLWYRIPIARDARNWRWPTLSAVMEGRDPIHKLAVIVEGENPIDVSISNAGEADEEIKGTIAASWSDAGLTASDALTGWNVRSETGRATFSVTAQNGLLLAPGAERKIGWLRFDRPTNLRTEFSNQ